MRYESEEKAKILGFPTAKELRQAKETAEARLRREEEAEESVGLVSISSTQVAQNLCNHSA
jgi:DNA-directed RNA polymerase III subunit RPC3